MKAAAAAPASTSQQGVLSWRQSGSAAADPQESRDYCARLQEDCAYVRRKFFPHSGSAPCGTRVTSGATPCKQT